MIKWKAVLGLKIACIQDMKFEEMRIHEILQSECTIVHKDCKILQQRSR